MTCGSPLSLSISPVSYHPQRRGHKDDMRGLLLGCSLRQEAPPPSPLSLCLHCAGLLRSQIRRCQAVQSRLGSVKCPKCKDSALGGQAHTGVQLPLPGEGPRARLRSARWLHEGTTRQGRDTARPRHCLPLCRVTAGQATRQSTSPRPSEPHRVSWACPQANVLSLSQTA